MLRIIEEVEDEDNDADGLKCQATLNSVGFSKLKAIYIKLHKHLRWAALEPVRGSRSRPSRFASNKRLPMILSDIDAIKCDNYEMVDKINIYEMPWEHVFSKNLVKNKRSFHFHFFSIFNLTVQSTT